MKVLVINCGSSTIKFQLIEMENEKVKYLINMISLKTLQRLI